MFVCLHSNTAYGSLLIDKTKHTAVSYTDDLHSARQAVNKNNFKSLSSIGGNVYEITRGKLRMILDTPNFIAHNLLCLAKQHQLQMLYGFLHVFLDKTLFSVTLCDTDSLGIECGREQIEDCVKPEMKDEFNRLLYGCCDQKEPDKNAFMPRLCCNTHIAWDKRRSGLYKYELQDNTCCVALSAKCYLMSKKDDSVVIKAKGVQRPYESISDPVQTFKRVLQKQEFVSCTNKGFRSLSGSVLTYEVSKLALSNFYCKRIVLGPLGIYTKPLEVVLNPFPKHFHCLVLDKPDLSPACTNKKYLFKMNEAVFPSILHALLVHKLYFVSEIKSYDFLKPRLQKIMQANEETELLAIYNNLPSSDEWERDLESLLVKIIQCRISQHLTLSSQLQSTDTLPFVYATKQSHILGSGYPPQVCKYHSPAAESGHNLIGKAYSHVKQSLPPPQKW